MTRLDEEPPADDLVHESRIRYDNGADVAVTIVDVLAEVQNQPVTDLLSSIDDAVDPGALDRIVRPLPDGTPRNGWVTFALCDCTIRLYGDGRLQIFDDAEVAET